eukprot:TRINITY_DN547_c0_g1_i3.p1 TRINITY_DN547_c0_g1~~TRINITY_DN547_c0_g1_i3.p1  ORF type:complete len:236 (-),score=15.86 TRINITY_DN547_c0_g1_i3:178-885(-)
MPSLLSLQSLRAKYGSSLQMVAGLHRILQSKILHSASILCPSNASRYGRWKYLYSSHDYLKISRDTQKKSLSVADYVILVSYVVMFLLFLVLAKFFYFHVKLCVDNLTTLETLNKERGNMEGYGEYDSGATYNWKQVFGNDAAFWICPFSTESSRPVGDGIVWPKRASTYAANGTNIDLPETMTPYNNKNGEKPSPMANGYNGKSSLPQIPNYSPGGFTQGQAFGTNGMYHKRKF